MSETITYTFLATAFSNVLVRSTDGAFIPCDPANRDYQEYLSLLEAGKITPPDGWTGPTNG